MANIAATDVAISLLPTRSATNLGSVHPVDTIGKQHVVLARLSISATAGLAYPSSGGIPLPTRGLATGPGDNSYGMVRNVSHLIIVDAPMRPSSTRAVVWRYDQANHAIRGYQAPGFASGIGPTEGQTATGLSELPTTWKPSFGAVTGSSLDFIVQVWGW